MIGLGLLELLVGLTEEATLAFADDSGANEASSGRRGSGSDGLETRGEGITEFTFEFLVEGRLSVPIAAAARVVVR